MNVAVGFIAFVATIGLTPLVDSRMSDNARSKLTTPRPGARLRYSRAVPTPPLAPGSWRPVARPRPPVTIWVVVGVMLVDRIWGTVSLLSLAQAPDAHGLEAGYRVLAVLGWAIVVLLVVLLLRGTRAVPYILTSFAALNLTNLFALGYWESWVGLALAAVQMVALWHPMSRAYLREARASRRSRVKVRPPG